MNNTVIKNVHKIAILRANGLGDFIVTLPAIQAVRTAYPTAEIVLLGKPWHAEFIKQKRTPIDRVIVIPVFEHVREEVGVAPDEVVLQQFFNDMQKEKFDIAIHFQGKGIASGIFLKKLNARITAGHSCPEAVGLDYTTPYYYYQNEVVRYLEAARLIGATDNSLEPRIELLEEDKQEARYILDQLKVETPYVVLHPGATDLRRQWPLEKFAELGDSLAQKGYNILFTGDEGDEGVIQNLIASMTHPAVYACKGLSLGGLAALLANSILVISNDTGPLHLARAVGTKTVGIYWAPNIINWGPLVLEKHRQVISWDMQCPRCGIVPNSPYPFEPKLPTCDHPFSFVRNIEVKEVIERAEELLPATLNKDTRSFKPLQKEHDLIG